MEDRLKVSVLLTSPLILSLSLCFKYRFWSPIVSIMSSMIFVPIGLIMRKTFNEPKVSSINIIVKFLMLGFFIGFEASVFQDMSMGVVSGFLMVSSFSSIFLALWISCYSMRESAELRYPWLFSLSSLDKFYGIADTFAVLVVSGALGYGISIYLALAYLSTSWIYSHLYIFFIWIVGIVVLAVLFSEKITAFILTRQKPNVYKY